MALIGLHDADQTGFPNLALMKLSAHHKAKGDDVEWWMPLRGGYDRLYSSKVFTFTEGDPYLPETAIVGGTGSGNLEDLPHEIESLCPDYDLYGINYSMGFLTRGCPRKCDWCVVPAKEGGIRPDADIEDFARHEEVVLLDNNILAHQHGLEQLEKIAGMGLRIDCNQGLDARLITEEIAALLARVKWRAPIRLACDHMGMMKYVGRAVEALRYHNAVPRRYFCYVLVRDIDDALQRVRFLKGLDVDPFAQPYIPEDGTDPDPEWKHFARWVNHKAEFKSRTWESYREARGEK